MNTYLWALFAREVKRFQKLWLDTVFSPIVSIGLYLAVFGVIAFDRSIDGIPYLAYLYSGLLAMILVNSSFSNPAFALIISKNVGTMIDLQLAPFAPWKVGLAYAMAALTRAIVTLIITITLTIWFIPIRSIANPLLLLFTIVITGIQFGMLGVSFGMKAKNFEALTFMTTFIMQPMIFLAGVFYPVSSLPAPWATISAFNPIHHTVNLVRYSITGYSDIAPMISLGVVLALTAILFAIMTYTTRKGLMSA